MSRIYRRVATFQAEMRRLGKTHDVEATGKAVEKFVAECMSASGRKPKAEGAQRTSK